MPATTRKGKAKSASSGDGDNPSETEAIEAADDRSGRARKPSKKQAEINEDKQTAVKRKLEAMQKEYKKLKQQAKKLKTSKAGSKTSESAGNASESSSESSSFSPESEEEDETVATTRKHQSADATARLAVCHFRVIARLRLAVHRLRATARLPVHRLRVNVHGRAVSFVTSASWSFAISPLLAYCTRPLTLAPLATTLLGPFIIIPTPFIPTAPPSPLALPPIITITRPLPSWPLIFEQPDHLGAPPPALPAQAGQPPTGDLKDPPFLHGRTPTGKPKAGDYEAHVNKMIVRACHQYEVLIATEDAFPDLGTQDGWATQVWTDTCKRTQVFYKLTERVEKIITGRDSHARGGLRDKIRPHIAATYGFVTDGSERAKGANRERYRFLLDCDASKPEPVFHYKDVESRSGFAHNVLILRALQDHWFADGTSPGIKYASQFSPIREVTLALVFTTIQFCLDQWADGTFNKHHMYTEKAYKSQYDMHLRHIRDWCAMDVNASRTVRQRLYDRARRASGAAPVTAPCPGLSDSSKERLRAELAAQAAACDSDAEENA
ncbi:hypothetical protein BN946_scf184985.g53 [Trametes cinnabarina]|uniref:DUF6532 domain-containing protein n=1 Tax=Pycnoporus cinnabarinus TaxID=5643 RepID=A0A060SK66_PYCCI|nr:hypothetical protein BN946_scf184985.g53 [Trametes cinnabarina]